MIGRYEIVSPLGAGGMGAVYRARDSNLKREIEVFFLISGVTPNAD
jgi:serine/threonine protein kinase